MTGSRRGRRRRFRGRARIRSGSRSASGPITKRCTTSVEIVDTTPPALDVPAPVVIRTSELGGACAARVRLVASARDICDGAPTISHVTIPDAGSGGAEADHEFGFGTTRVVFTAADGSGNLTTGETSVTIIDDTPPRFVRLTANPTVLWPPNHRMVSVAADLEVTDSCDASPSVELVSITSSEPANTRGDGNTGLDILDEQAGNDDRAFSLRAERDGRGPGRTQPGRAAYGGGCQGA